MAGRSPAAILYDSSGNAVGVILDGAVYRLQGITKVLNSGGTQIDPATQGTLASIKDTDGIKKITDALPAGTNNIGDVDVVSSALPTGAATETTLSALNVNAADIETILTAIRDTAGVKKITDSLPAGTNRIGAVRNVDANDAAIDLARDTSIPSGSRGFLMVGEDGSGVARAVDIRVDPNDSKRRLQIEGKVLAVTTPIAPPSSTTVSIAADSPLSINTTTDTTYTIPNGVTFYLQQVVGGSEGDTSERGSVIEVFYYDGTTNHIVERVYVNGFTTYVAVNDLSKSRDATSMVGDGSTKLIRVRRRRLSGSAQEVDAVVRGYVQ